MIPAGRFARARGTSLFARAFNHELPRRMSSFACVFPDSLKISLAEKPLSGFAEQIKSAVSLSIPLVLDSEQGGLSEDAEEAEAQQPVIVTSWMLETLLAQHRGIKRTCE